MTVCVKQHTLLLLKCVIMQLQAAVYTFLCLHFLGTVSSTPVAVTLLEKEHLPSVHYGVNLLSLGTLWYESLLIFKVGVEELQSVIRIKYFSI